MVTDAVTHPGPWSAAGILILAVVVAAALRTKISAAWIWIPALIAGTYLTVFRWLRLR